MLSSFSAHSRPSSCGLDPVFLKPGAVLPAPPLVLVRWCQPGMGLSFPPSESCGWNYWSPFPDIQFSQSVQSLSCVRLFETPWTAAHQASLSITNSRSFTQTHVHGVSDAIQPPRPLLSPSPPAFNLSQHQSLFQWVSSSHQVAKVLEFQLHHQSFQRIFRTDFL